ncbi:MAG: cysteinyl-tRNA synthetase [Trebonia sp.]|nr:cysteinyl-tRNA synthetase [Trebonia sp.]
MTLRLFDTAFRAVREFRPVTHGEVSVYLCGATVQGAPHLGHLRSAVCFDILVRWLEASGQQVTYCRNVTDIDDKILRAAAAAEIPWWELAERNHREFTTAYALVGCRPPDVEPRATGHIPDMIALIERLTTSGHAYATGGDVYFDVDSAQGYGTLSGQQLAGQLPAGSDEAEAANPLAHKRDPRDFVLWKGAKPGEPAWSAPWGPGRPGWHIECSAMATGYLGSTFDIHGGGQDLIFPHHENERAQSWAAGDEFARYWVHHGLVTVVDAKMSKSAGNALAVADALYRVRPQELRYYLGQAHYRSTVEYSGEAVEDAAAAYQRIERFVARAQHAVGSVAPSPEVLAPGLPISFTAALDDDLGVPSALAAVHATVRDGNYALSRGDQENVVACLAQARAMLGVLGLDPLSPAWPAGEQDGRLRDAVDALVGLALRQREAARARGDYASADSIRDTLEASGVVVEDTPEGTRWELAR